MVWLSCLDLLTVLFCTTGGTCTSAFDFLNFVPPQIQSLSLLVLTKNFVKSSQMVLRQTHCRIQIHWYDIFGTDFCHRLVWLVKPPGRKFPPTFAGCSNVGIKFAFHTCNLIDFRRVWRRSNNPKCRIFHVKRYSSSRYELPKKVRLFYHVILGREELLPIPTMFSPIFMLAYYFKPCDDSAQYILLS